jgi:hypothetical protein
MESEDNLLKFGMLKNVILVVKSSGIYPFRRRRHACALLFYHRQLLNQFPLIKKTTCTAIVVIGKFVFSAHIECNQPVCLAQA